MHTRDFREWDGPAVLPPNPRAYSWGAIRRRNTPMPRKFDTAVVTIGIDPGKNTLHLVGLDARGEIVLREKVALCLGSRMCRHA
jgi:hypothetical protein